MYGYGFDFDDALAGIGKLETVGDLAEGQFQGLATATAPKQPQPVSSSFYEREQLIERMLREAEQAAKQYKLGADVGVALCRTVRK